MDLRDVSGIGSENLKVQSIDGGAVDLKCGHGILLIGFSRASSGYHYGYGWFGELNIKKAGTKPALSRTGSGLASDQRLDRPRRLAPCDSGPEKAAAIERPHEFEEWNGAASAQ